MYELFKIGNNILPCILAVRSTEVFVGQLIEAMTFGIATGLIFAAIFVGYKNWKKKKDNEKKK